MATRAEIIAGLAQVRARSGAPASSVDDARWADRILAGEADFSTARQRIVTERGTIDNAYTRQYGGVSGGGSLGDVIRGGPGGENIGDGTRHLDEYLRNNPTTPGGGGGGMAPSEVDRARQQREANIAAVRALVGWLPPALVDIYVNEWVKHGQGELAWAVVRTTPVYDQHFGGIKRDDGSLRMTEQEFIAHREAYNREIMQWGFNPQLFANHHRTLVEGDVTIGEIHQRLEAKITGIVQNLPTVRERYGALYGINAMSDEALIAGALDPQIGLDLLQGRITAAQVSAEAALRGFNRGRTASERLVQAGGLDQQAARTLFSQAARAVPQIDRFARRFNDRGAFGIDEFEQAAVFGDTDVQRRMERLTSAEQAMFRRTGTIRQDQSGLTGLRER